MKKTNFLSLPDLKIRIKSVDYSKNIKEKNGKYYCSSNHAATNDFNMEVLFQEFQRLGKKIYETDNNFINVIPYRDTIQITRTNSLILKLEILNDDRIISIVKEWCANHPVYFNPAGPEDYKDENEVEVFALLDMAVFSYLVLSSLNNYYIKKKSERAEIDKRTREKFMKAYEKCNHISFDTFTETKDLDKFLPLISNIMFEYERHYYVSINEQPHYNYNRPLLFETTSLRFNDSTKECELERVFENIYSVFWITIKAQIFSMNNDNKLFGICRCGEVILGKSEHCEQCKKAIDRERKEKTSQIASFQLT